MFSHDDSLGPHGQRMRFPRQEYWSGLPFPLPGNLPDPGIKPRCSALQADSLLSELPGKLQKMELGIILILIQL